MKARKDEAEGARPCAAALYRLLDFACCMNTFPGLIFELCDPQFDIKLRSQEVQYILLISNWINE